MAKRTPTAATSASGAGGCESVKVVLLGDGTVGKTSIVQRFAFDRFNEDQATTMGAMFISKWLDFPALGFGVKFHIWDTAGQEQYHCMASIYYQDAAAAIVVFDVTRPETLEGIKKWIEELKAKGPENIQIVIVGNKSDLVEQQKVNIEDAKAYAEKEKAEFLLTSAKAGFGINDIFTAIAEKLKKVTKADLQTGELVNK